MSLYQLHRCVYDSVRAGEVGSRAAAPFDDGVYELTEDERAAFQAEDVGKLYEFGLHPVLLNAYCRSIGYTRDDYKAKLAPYASPDDRRGRWQR